MKILVIVAHPNLAESRINKTWMEFLQGEDEVTVHNLYDVYGSKAIDVEAEQKLLLEHDRIVLQFPFYWYSSPALLKQWQDEVLQYGFAYGSQGEKLHGKQLMLAISTGGPQEAYQAGGSNLFSMSELLKPFQAMANLTGMKFLPAFCLHGVRVATDEEIHESARKLAEQIKKQ